MAKKLPILLQAEAAECGIASLAMVLNYYGHEIDMIFMRKKHETSLAGTTLKELMDISVEEDLEPRPVKVELDSIHELELPCIIHWDLNHFCVLKEVTNKSVVIHDPATGVVKMSIKRFGRHFTGIALELIPTTKFEKKIEKSTISIRSLIGDPAKIVPLLAQIFVLTILLQLFALVTPLYGQIVIDEVVVSADYNLLLVLAISFFLVLIFEHVIEFFQRWVSLYLSSCLSLVVGVNVFRHLLRLPMSYFEKRHIGDIVSRFEGIESIKNFLLEGAVKLLVAVIMVILSFILMLTYSTLLAAIVLAGSAIQALLGYLSFQKLYDKNNALIVAKANEDSNFMETVRSMQAIKLFNKENERKSLWLNHYAKVINSSVVIEKIDMAFDAARGLVAGLEHILVYALAAHFVIQDELSVGMVIAFIAYKSSFSNSFERTIDGYIDFRMIRIEQDRLADIVLTELEEHYEGPLTSVHYLGKLTLENISYRYSATSPPVFSDISFEIQPGESVVITGPSGVGKSTLLKILLGLFQPSTGTVSLDDRPINKIGLKNYRQQVATVMQDDTLFSGSILDNITLFSREFEMDDVIEVCQLVCIHDDIESFQMGYQTLVGDMGSTLSGGQKQRILLARALFRKPKILVLDEATSALDLELEKKISSALSELKISRISIAHRKETIKFSGRCLHMTKDGIREIK